MTSTRVTFHDEDQFEYVDHIREVYGLTWRGLMIRGAERLESTSPFPDDDEPAQFGGGDEGRQE